MSNKLTWLLIMIFHKEKKIIFIELVDLEDMEEEELPLISLLLMMPDLFKRLRNIIAHR